MTTLPLFELPADGWYQISAKGEFPHKPTGLLQVIDDDACRRMLERFSGENAHPNFPGLLVDFDHFSLDQDKPTEAAGWIVGLEPRSTGLWAQIRWTDRGAESVRGGRYRFISPVWRQDDCEAMENNRVRPTRLLNCALTNDPNITGMVPLSNSVRPRAQPSPRVHVADVYLFNRAIANAQLMTDEQRKAMFARMGHSGGGYGGGGGGRPAGGPSAADTSSGVELGDTVGLNDVARQSADRINEFNRQIRELEAQRTVAPTPPNYEEVDTRALQREMLAAGKTTNETFAAVKAAEAENQRKRDALREVRSRARRAYPGDPEKQRKYFDKLLADETKAYEKDLAAWSKESKSLQGKIDKLVAARNTEEIRQKEEVYKSAQRQMRGDAEDEERLARQQQTAAQRQVEADKRAAREQAEAAEKARVAAEKAAAKAGQKTDPATAYRSELGRRRLYWQAAARGEWEAARQLYPNADHERNRKDLEALIPKSGSKANQAAYQNALARMQAEAP